MSGLWFGGHFATIAAVMRWCRVEIEERDKLLNLGHHAAYDAQYVLLGPNHHMLRTRLREFVDRSRPLVPRRPEPAPDADEAPQ